LAVAFSMKSWAVTGGQPAAARLAKSSTVFMVSVPAATCTAPPLSAAWLPEKLTASSVTEAGATAPSAALHWSEEEPLNGSTPT
jgi:hypothetical protein